jgi:hypothetical protein
MFSDAITQFLDSYQSAEGEADRGRLLELFAPTFVAGDVNGTQPVTREQFALGLQMRTSWFAARGYSGSRLLSHEYVSFGSSLAMLSTTWSLDFVPAERGPVSVVTMSDFLLHGHSGSVQALAYIARQDVMAEIEAALS